MLMSRRISVLFFLALFRRWVFKTQMTRQKKRRRPWQRSVLWIVPRVSRCGVSCIALCRITSCLILSCCIASFRVVPCRTASCRVVSCRAASRLFAGLCRIASCRVVYVVPCRTASCSRRLVSCRIASFRRLVSCRLVYRRLVSGPIVSCRSFSVPNRPRAVSYPTTYLRCSFIQDLFVLLPLLLVRSTNSSRQFSARNRTWRRPPGKQLLLRNKWKANSKVDWSI